MNSSKIALIASAILLVILGGCASPQSTASAAPKPTSTPLATERPAPTRTPTPRPAATVAAVPSATVAPTATVTPVPQNAPNITVTSPTAGAKISSPVRVTGTARVFEAVVQVEIKDADGKAIGKATTMASTGAPERSNYSVDVSFTPPAKEQPGTVNVFALSARDGSLIDLVTVKVTLAPKT